MYYLKNNLHPIWYEVSDVGAFVPDKDGNKVPRFDIPPELKRLSMTEKFLIQKCSNYVPLVHLSNGVFALKGHCVTFPQVNIRGNFTNLVEFPLTILQKGMSSIIV